MLDYRGKLVLAPMVRVSELPTRLLALKYGADLVWGPEIVDKKLITCRRVWNEKIKCVEFLEKNGDKMVFRTCPELEKSRLVFQLGTCNAQLAVQAAKLVASDVSVIDVNSGCPKHFSIHSGMGAALLQTPDLLVSILQDLVKEVGQPFKIGISVKIRILDTEEKTISLVQRLVKTGIQCLTVHCRTTPMRPREPVIRDSLRSIAQVCRDAGVACLVNGDVQGRWDLPSLIDQYSVDGAMIARGAESNASCFQHKLLPWQQVVPEYMKYARQFDNHYINTKFCLARMIPGKDPLFNPVARSKSHADIEKALESLVRHSDESDPLFKDSKDRINAKESVSLPESPEISKKRSIESADLESKRIHIDPAVLTETISI